MIPVTGLVAAVTLLIGSAAVAETISSAYTPFDVDACRHRKGRDVEDYGEWRCVGHAGIPVVMHAGDQRIYVSYGARASDELAARETLASFNGEGKTIEWRIAGTDAGSGAGKGTGTGRPFATIMRWSTTVVVDEAQAKDGLFRGQVLVVTRLGPRGVCHVGYVDGRANPNANDLAREIADRHARAFRCGKDKPIVLGEKGLGFSPPYGPAD
jgi:hypothetical protein